MERHYVLTAIGSQGRSSFAENELRKYRKVIQLSGYPRELAEHLIHECYTVARQGNTKIEIAHNCLDNAPEAMLMPELGAALINRPLYEPRYDITNLFDSEMLSLCQKHIGDAVTCFQKAKLIHDDWEKIYIAQTDFNSLNRLANDVIESLLSGRHSAHRGSFCDRFFGAATINGSVDYIDNLTAGLKRYFIKGRPGTGKSTFMKKFASAACDNGFHVERYHCAFDPSSLDMVVVRELNLCLFDSTAPHEYFPSMAEDEIIDFYETAVHPETDTRFEKEISLCRSDYRDTIGSAINSLVLANEACKRCEDEYRAKCSVDKIMSERNNILKKLFS